MNEQVKELDTLREDVRVYLNDLRHSGVTNMFGAGAFLQNQFGMDRREAAHQLKMWMQSF